MVALDGSEPAFAELEAIREALKRRGPDGAGTWIGKGAALGHTLLATTPESLVETMPLHHGESGCTITADARLDNRDELFSKLGLNSGQRVVGDGELILRAYLNWSADCVDHLLGDFAFAIWDGRTRRLFCARDQMGMRQLTYWHLEGRLFVFATEPAAVLRHPAVPQDLNLGRIADFLDDLEHFDSSSTFYAAVSRLPAAHSLVVDGRGLRLRKYWALSTPPLLKLKSDEDYADAFIDVFRTAVGCRLRSPGTVGSMLSGGMDSGSVTAVAAELLAQEGRGPLPTFSVTDVDPEGCPETRAIHAAAQISGIEPRFVSLADLGPYRDDLVRLTREEAEPFDGQMGLLRAVYLSAHHAGLKVVLDGVSGDLAMYSDSYIARLFRRGRIGHAWQEARSEREIWGEEWPTWRSLGRAAGRAWLPRPVRAARRRIGWWSQDRRIGRSELISRVFAERTDLSQRRQQIRGRDYQFDRLDEQERARRIEHVNLIVGRERYDRVASGVAIEPRDPFIDLRVFDFCLSLPWDQLQSGGWPKLVLRRSMAGKLPDTVRWRKGKEHLGGALTRAVFGRLAEGAVRERHCRETIAPYIDLRGLDGGGVDPLQADDYKLRSLYLYFWLDRAVVATE
jgi:asparagine synthase (glutamine-hydrolysing)